MKTTVLKVSNKMYQAPNMHSEFLLYNEQQLLGGLLWWSSG